MTWLISLFGGHWWRWRQRVEADFIAIRSEAFRIEGKADTAINKAVDVGADTSVMLKRAADAIDKCVPLSHMSNRLRWQEEEMNKLCDFAGKIDAYLETMHGTTYRQSVPYRMPQ